MKRMMFFALLVYFLVAALSTSSVLAETITVGEKSPDYSGENCIPFGCPELFSLSRYQQVYSADAFSGPMNILSITFFNSLRIGYESNKVTPATYVVGFSTTSAPVGGLDPVNLENNIGADSLLFFSGALGGSLAHPEFTITGAAPFQYDPREGNLLLDIAIIDAGPDSMTFFDFQQPADLFSRIFNGQPKEINTGLVTQFQYSTAAKAPEPGILTLLGAGLAGLAMFRRHHRT